MFWFELPVHFGGDDRTGTGASTLADVTSAGAGTFTAPITGTGASTLTGVTSAGTGSIPVVFAHYDASTLGLSNGATVTTWPDTSINGNDLAQTGGAALPTYATNSLNGLGGVVFGAAQRIADTTLSGTVPATKTVIFVAYNPPNDGTVKYITEPPTDLIAKWSQADRWIFGNSDTNFIEFTESGLVSTPRLWTFVLQQTGAFVRMDQVQKVSGNLNAPVADTSTVLGSTANTGTGFILYEYFIYDGALTASQIDTVEDYLYNKWFVAAPITGTGATTLAGASSAGSGTYTPAAITGTGSSTLSGVTSAGTGTFTGAITGTGTATLTGVTSTGSGTFTLPAITGTGASTLTGVTSTGSGTLINPITGTGASTLQGVTSTGTGMFQSSALLENITCTIRTPLQVVCSVRVPLNATCRVVV